MPVNRNALIRFRTIDNCLRNSARKWTLEDLIEACSEALYEYEGIDKGVSTRTVQMDIQLMRSDKLGYNAPIVVSNKKHYSYSDPKFSITNNPLSGGDLDKLTEVVDILRHFKRFSHFQEMVGMIHRLEDKVNSAKGKGKSIVHLETNENLRGIEFIDSVYQSIKNKQVLLLTYQSFKARTPNVFSFHAYLLKEYRNRWFVLGRKSSKEPLVNLALDRIKEIKIAEEVKYIDNLAFDADEYYKDVIGVTVNEGNRPQLVHLAIDRTNAPYVITKPLHHTQKVVAKSADGIEITIEVILNFELEREILGFGDSIVVLKPQRLRERIHKKFETAISKYTQETKI
ncbi:MAG: WYL domain-containing protein [Cyclobacteriaceae bacterium]|nr:WYL domain-containing protein [Cyclobacteriaceae bacterium]